MRQYYRFIFIIIAICSLFVSMAGCSMQNIEKLIDYTQPSRFSITMSNGDNTLIECTKVGGVAMTRDGSVVVFSDDNGKVLGKLVSTDEDTMQEYVELNKEYLNPVLCLQLNGLAHTIFECSGVESDITYVVVGWIVGTNTGIMMETYGSYDELVKITASWDFTTQTTNQKNNEYFPEFVMVQPKLE